MGINWGLPEFRFAPFGSTANGFIEHGSDLDVVLLLCSSAWQIIDSSSKEITEARLLELIDTSPNRRVACTVLRGLFRKWFGTGLDCNHAELKRMIRKMPSMAMKGEDEREVLFRPISQATWPLSFFFSISPTTC